MSDWERLLVEFKAVVVDQGNSGHKLAAARSLVKFLKLTGSAINEVSLLEWTVQNAQTCPAKLVVARLLLIDPFLDFLAERRDISRHAARMIRERPDLLIHLQSCGVLKSRIPVVAYWEPHLRAMVASLRGLSIGYQIQLIEAARSFVARLPAGPLENSTWEAILWKWMDEVLSDYSLENVRSKFMPGLDRFLHELVHGGECPEHLLRLWRQKQSGWVDALRRRQQGAPAQLRPPRYASVLAPHLEAFLDFKRSLGRKRLSLASLRMLDRYLVAREVPDLVSIGPTFLIEFLSSRNWRATSRKKATGDLRQFFHFLERRELLSPQKNPARNLPRTRCKSRLPYIFPLREIANLLTELLQDPIRPPFDQTMQFTIFHLLYACGLRISEPLLLQVQDIHWEDQSLSIRGTKFGKERQIPFGPRAGEHLARYHQMRIQRLGNPPGDAPFFVRAVGRPPNSVTLRTAFREACRRAGVGSPDRPQPRPHDLRHSMAVHRLYKWYLEGADPQKRLVLLSIYMGHVAPSCTQHYLNLSQDLLRVAGRALERDLESWLEESPPPHER